MKYTSKKAASILRRDRKQWDNDIATGHCGHIPEAVSNLRYWEADDLAGELFFMEGRADGHSVRIAGALSTRLREAMRAYPAADQLTFGVLENGNRFALPTDTLNLSSGYNSGGMVREALIVDVRNLRARVQRLIEADAQIAGERDED